MFWDKKKDKPLIKLEGCLDETKKTNLCKHGNGGYCWFCHTGIEPIDNTNEEKPDSFGESGAFKNA